MGNCWFFFFKVTKAIDNWITVRHFWLHVARYTVLFKSYSHLPDSLMSTHNNNNIHWGMWEMPADHLPMSDITKAMRLWYPSTRFLKNIQSQLHAQAGDGWRGSHIQVTINNIRCWNFQYRISPETSRVKLGIMKIWIACNKYGQPAWMSVKLLHVCLWFIQSTKLGLSHIRPTHVGAGISFSKSQTLHYASSVKSG